VPVTSLIVEGKLVGPRVEELDKCWKRVVAAYPKRSMLVDLAHVNFVDSEGRALLTTMRRKGVKLLASGVLINSICRY
jgi:ABC-type transporter Mla MlaB component